MIEKYKDLLDKYTYDALGYEDHSQSRYESFLYCLKHLENIKNAEVLEIGTSRSFVSGAYEGCNSSNAVKFWNPNDFSKWDWGAGFATFIFGQVKCNLTTVDIVDEHIWRCKKMTDSLGIRCNHVVSDSVKFLSKTDKKYDVIYLDSGDVFPIEPSIELQLQEVKIIIERDLLTTNGLILIDDVKNKTPRELGIENNTLGKSEKSIPFLLENGFEVIFDGYQYIMRKK